MPQYLHDADERIVYQMPGEPDITERIDRRGRRLGWTATMCILITKADNKLLGSQWLKPTSSYPRQDFAAHYEKDQIRSYFFMHHKPKGNEITKDEYTELQALYDKIASNQ